MWMPGNVRTPTYSVLNLQVIQSIYQKWYSLLIQHNNHNFLLLIMYPFYSCPHFHQPISIAYQCTYSTNQFPP